MRRCRFALFTPLIAAVVVLWHGSVHADRDAQLARAEEMLESLGSKKFLVRTRASHELEKIVATAPLWLTHHLAHRTDQSDPEAQLRLVELLKLSRVGETYKIIDAVGNPIAGALIETFELPERSQIYTTRQGKLLGRSLTNARGWGHVHQPVADQVSSKYSVRVHAPGYGTAGFIAPRFRQRRPVRLPLVRNGTIESQRSIRGTIVDQSSRPIRHASVICRSIRVPTGGARTLRGDVSVLSDDEGRFRAYGTFDRNDNLLAPKFATMQIIVRDSDESYFPTIDHIAIGQEQTVALAKGSQFHEFAFSSLDSDAKPTLYFDGVDPPRTRVQLDPQILREGGNLVLGRYSIYVADQSYLPITVTDASPRRLIFEPKFPPAYTGNVIDGITGESFRDAIVFCYDSTRQSHLTQITDEQLLQWSDVDVDDIADHEIVRSLKRVYGIRGVTKSDVDGRFSLVPTPGGAVHGIIVWSAGHLPVTRRLPSSAELRRADIQRDQLTSDIPMYPSARIRFEPVLANQDEPARVTFWPVWDIRSDKQSDGSGQQPDWFAEFRSAQQDSPLGLPTFHPCFELLEANQLHEVLVPADVTFKLKLDSAYNEDWSPILPSDAFHLAPGEIANLGKLRSTPTIPVTVQVRDVRGNPVESCPVRFRYLDLEGSWEVGKLTDAHGVATMKIAKDISGEFGVIDLELSRDALRAANLKQPFRITRDHSSSFEIELTDQQIAAIKQR